MKKLFAALFVAAFVCGGLSGCASNYESAQPVPQDHANYQSGHSSKLGHY